jgi:PAS domain S-box-containing protein
MRIGELARRTGVGVSALRAWESRFGFLEPERSPAGHRLYLETDVERVEAVLRFVSEGLTLSAATARVVSSGTGALPAGEGDSLLYGQILGAVNQGIWVSRDGRTRYVNRRMAELMGCSVDDLLTLPVFELHDPMDLDTVEERAPTVPAGGRLRFTQTLRRPDGSTFLAEIDTTPLFDRAGRGDGAVAMVSDVTARAEAEARSWFGFVLLDSIGEAVAAADPGGRLVYVNAAAERLFGWRAADVIGKDGRKLIAAPDASADADRIHGQLLDGQRYAGNLTLTRSDGTEFVARLTAAPSFDQHGTLLGLIAIITDQTERDRLGRERRGLESQMETLAILGALALRRRAGPAAATSLILKEAVEAIRRQLEADHATVFDVIAGDDEVRARVASRPLGPTASVSSGSNSFAGYVALARKVVVVGDTRHDRRFESRDTWPGFRTASAIGAPIFGPEGIRGVLTAESSRPDRFDLSAGHFLQAIANITGVVLLGPHFDGA